MYLHEEIKSDFIQTFTVKQWFGGDVFPSAWEYRYFYENFKDIFVKPMQNFTYEQASYLLSFDMLFSGTRV